MQRTRSVLSPASIWNVVPMSLAPPTTAFTWTYCTGSTAVPMIQQQHSEQRQRREPDERISYGLSRSKYAPDKSVTGPHTEQVNVPVTSFSERCCYYPRLLIYNHMEAASVCNQAVSELRNPQIPRSRRRTACEVGHRRCRSHWCIT